MANGSEDKHWLAHLEKNEWTSIFPASIPKKINDRVDQILGDAKLLKKVTMDMLKRIAKKHYMKTDKPSGTSREAWLNYLNSKTRYKPGAQAKTPAKVKATTTTTAQPSAKKAKSASAVKVSTTDAKKMVNCLLDADQEGQSNWLLPTASISIFGRPLDPKGAEQLLQRFGARGYNHYKTKIEITENTANVDGTVVTVKAKVPIQHPQKKRSKEGGHALVELKVQQGIGGPVIKSLKIKHMGVSAFFEGDMMP
eukprot:TRINITY_DN9370_c0_g2_i1.p1 TRINITY_DN9370_c0_g2~~TRINITY_DN9370_c0_g2_i1.p1  ORF type:complete len:253 (+),score=60.67 TRINITY_DN9370_c0_g2_i1:41-799(+)